MIRKILIVDDDQIMLRALEKKLAKYKETFSLIMCKDGVDAVSVLEDHFISLVVMDLKMPRMDGISLLTHVKGKFPDISVIIISGYKTADLYSLAKKKGVVAYISKPFQVDDLAKVMLSTLQREADGGTMNNVSPVVFLQLMEMEGRSCTIRVVDKKSKKGGVLYFQGGKLIDARMDTVYGIDGAYIIFGWEDVTLYIQNECPPKKNVINSDLQPIIMKAVEMKDDLDDIGSADSPIAGDIPGDLLGEAMPSESFSRTEEEVVVETFEEIPAPVKQAKPAPKKEVQIPFGERVRNLLEREVGERCGLEDIYEDENMKSIVSSFSELGTLFKFGSLKVAYIKRGKETDQIILPGNVPTVINVSAKGPNDKIIRVLSSRLQVS